MVYELEGPAITISYRRSEEKLAISGENLLSHDDLDAVAVVEADTGVCVTATLLESSRNGTRVMLTLLLPEVEGSEEPAAVSGVAIITKSFSGVVGGPPPVLHDMSDVRQLEGTAAPAD